MKLATKPYLMALIALIASIAAVTELYSQAATHVFNNGGVGSDWGTPENWNPVAVPNGNTTVVQMNQAPNVEADYTVGFLRNSFGSGSIDVTGSGTLTVDINNATSSVGINNVYGGAGSGTLTFSGNITIQNTLAAGTNGITYIDYSNPSPKTTTFAAGSTLTLNTLTEARVNSGAGESINFNGSLAGSTALRLNGTGITFGTAADNSAYTQNLVLLGNGTSVVSNTTVVGGFLDASTGSSRLQVNSNNISVQLNGAESMAGGITIAGSNTFTLDVNANQSNMGVLNLGNGGSTFVLDIDGSVASLFFADSSGVDWTGGTFSILGFQENLIKFGGNADGLTVDQLALINGGIYSLTGTGYLTAVPEPSTFALFGGIAALGMILIRRRRA